MISTIWQFVKAMKLLFTDQVTYRYNIVLHIVYSKPVQPDCMVDS